MPIPFNLNSPIMKSNGTGLADSPTSIDAFIDRATEVLGDRETALRWMGTPVQALDYSTPVSLLTTDAGFTE